jgi:L,D-peptidoglycan transpeptidase YkuD (ErfK/YbiS/YcfS/YnhG family)
MRATVTAAGIFKVGNHSFRAALGYGGVKADKREGDGGTPAALLPLREILYRPDRLAPPQGIVPARPLTPLDGWCDDPADPAYNRAVQLPYAASAEALWRDDASYDIIGVLGWNDDPPVPGNGSAIFLHLARFDYASTEGCIALELDHLRRTLALGLTEILVTA